MALDIAQRTVVLTLPETDAVRVQRDVPYAGDLTMDVYSPPDATSETPAVVIVGGYPDPGFETMVGCKFKDMGSSVSWARLIAASGMKAIAYTNREPEADLHKLLDHIGSPVGILATSGHVPLALSLLLRDAPHRVRCAALCYGYAFEAEEQARQFRFAYPVAGKSIDDLVADVPLFVARAGRDEMPRLKETLDGFIGAALVRNMPITIANHPDGPHAFDLMDDSEATRAIVEQILAFLRAHLLR